MTSKRFRKLEKIIRETAVARIENVVILKVFHLFITDRVSKINTKRKMTIEIIPIHPRV